MARRPQRGLSGRLLSLLVLLLLLAAAYVVLSGGLGGDGPLAAFVATPTPAARATPPAAEPAAGGATARPSTLPGPTGPALPPGLTSASVVDVVDGDTLEVVIGRRRERLRLIGVDTPETVAPNRPVECYGREASAFASELLAGQTVLLEADPSQDNRDRFDRLLRYVWLPDGRLVNWELVAGGYAFEYTFRVPYKYQREFREAQRDARERQRGLWSPEACGGQQIPAGTATAAPALTATPAGRCDPSYPDVCIPPPPPDLDCGDIVERRFRVVGADPHGFDVNGDGIACER